MKKKSLVTTDEIIKVLNACLDLRIHDMLYQKLEKPDHTFYDVLTNAETWLSTEFPYISFKYNGVWDTRKRTYKFFIRPTSEPYAASGMFLYGEIYVSSRNSSCPDCVTGYRLQCESISRFFQIGKLNQQLIKLNTHLRKIRRGESDLTVHELEDIFQDLYSSMEYAGVVDDTTGFIRYLKENVKMFRNSEFSLGKYFGRKYLALSAFGTCTHIPIRVKRNWFTLININ